MCDNAPRLPSACAPPRLSAPRCAWPARARAPRLRRQQWAHWAKRRRLRRCWLRLLSLPTRSPARPTPRRRARVPQLAAAAQAARIARCCDPDPKASPALLAAGPWLQRTGQRAARRRELEAAWVAGGASRAAWRLPRGAAACVLSRVALRAAAQPATRCALTRPPHRRRAPTSRALPSASPRPSRQPPRRTRAAAGGTAKTQWPQGARPDTRVAALSGALLPRASLPADVALPAQAAVRRGRRGRLGGGARGACDEFA